MDEMDKTQKYYYNNHNFNDSSNGSVYLNNVKDDDNLNNLSDTSVYINDAKDYNNSNDSKLVQEYDNYNTPLGDLYESDLSENINN
ncbi:673_t:CDS:2, partial [Funneliformis mosseae]